MSEQKVLDPEELLHLAILASSNNEAEKSIVYLKQALDIEPNNAKVHYMLGAMHAEIGMYQRAIEDMQKATELDASLDTAHFQLGLLHITSGNVVAAEQAWEHLNKLGEQHPLFLFKRGILALASDQFQQCIDDLTQGIELNTENLPLNKDMQNLIMQARQAIGNDDNNDSGEKKTEEHVFLSAYSSDDEPH